jgi:catechol 2,3-dioxygenase-like lactoylglutathione lyase family enzyme
MLGGSQAYAVAPVRDLQRARTFYAETLGLEPFPVPLSDDVAIAVLSAGDGSLVTLYRELEDETPMPATTVLGFNVDDLNGVLDGLRARGVEQYESNLPVPPDEHGVVALGPVRCAWIKDSEGNILILTELPSPPAAAP